MKKLRFDCEEGNSKTGKHRKMSLQWSPGAPGGLILVKKLASSCCARVQFNRLLCFRIAVLVLTYFTYMTYHMTRKPLSVVKNVLHQNCSELPRPANVSPTDDQWCNWAPFDSNTDANALLGMLDSAFLFSYAGAMFVSGFVAERVNLRYFLSFGMLASAVFCYLFGIARTYNIHNMTFFIFVQAGAGIAQTTGWPGCVSVVGNWFGKSKKGLIFGIWNSHTSVGNILGTLMASRFVETDWALSFVYPALVMGLVAFIVFLFLPPDPKVVGIALESDRPPPPESRRDSNQSSEVIIGDQAANLRPARHSANVHTEEFDERTSLLRNSTVASTLNPDAVSMRQALFIPGVVEFSMSLFFAKLVSYTFLFWLPLYIKNSTMLTPKESADLSTLFDVGGIVGAVLAGAAADHTGCPAITCVLFYTLSAPMLMLYQEIGSKSYILNVGLLFVNGLLVNAPYALITTAVSAELGTHHSLMSSSKALATVTAIIDGTGSVGAAIGPLLAGVVSGSSSWSNVFIMLIVCNFCALLLLTRVVKSEVHKLRTRRVPSARQSRIE